MLLSATSASGGFPISHTPIQTHPCPRLCNQPYGLLLFSAGWASSWYLGSAGPSSAFGCPSCWGGLSKFSSITACMCDVLHWLPISERIQYRITAMVSRCVLGCAPSYLRDLCCPVSVLAAIRVLRSAARGEFLVPWARLAIMQRRAFSVVGPSAWNDLPFELRSLLMAHPSKFYISLKSFFFVRDWTGSASE